MIAFMCALALAQAPVPKVEIPAEIKGDPNSFVTVLPTTNGKAVKYAYLDKGLNVFPSSLLANPIATVVTAPRGKYRLLAYTALGDVPSDPVIVVINIGNVPDAAPFGPYPPKPGPDPAPDEPDVPTPDNPDQKDQLEMAIIGIWGGLGSREKDAAKKVAKLAEIYREGARTALNADKDPISGKPYYETVGDVYTKVNALGRGALTNEDIFEIRDRLRIEMNNLLPRDPRIKLDGATRQKLVKEFNRYAAILEKLK